MKLGCSLGTYTFQDYKVERPAYSLHHCAVLKNTYFRHWEGFRRAGHKFVLTFPNTIRHLYCRIII